MAISNCIQGKNKVFTLSLTVILEDEEFEECEEEEPPSFQEFVVLEPLDWPV